MKQLKNMHWLIAILLLAVGLRLPYLSGSFWLDEAAQALESARPLSQQFDIIPDFQPPLLHLILHFSLYFGDSEWWLRTIGALVPGLISIWSTFHIGRRLHSERLGLRAALLLATSSFHIFYSQELRPYALPMMWAMLSWQVFLSLTLPTTNAKTSLKSVTNFRPWIVYTLITIAGLYSSYLYPFLVIGQGVWVVLQNRSRLKLFVLSMVATGLAFSVWLPVFSLQLAAGGEVRRLLPGWESVVSIPQLKSLPLVLGKFVYGMVDLKLSVFFVVTGVALLLMSLYVGKIGWSKRRQPEWGTIMLFLIWGLVPLITAWIISFWIPVVQPKRVLYLLPVFYLAIVWALEVSGKKTLTWIGLSLFVAINLWGTAQYYLNPVYQREDWRRLHQEVVSDYPADSVVFFAFPEPFAPWRWYDDGSYPTLSTGTLHVSEVEDLTEVVEKATQYRFVIIFDYLRDLSDPNHLVEKELEAFGYTLVELKDYPNIGFVRIYGKPGATLSTRAIYETRN